MNFILVHFFWCIVAVKYCILAIFQDSNTIMSMWSSGNWFYVLLFVIFHICEFLFQKMFYVPREATIVSNHFPEVKFCEFQPCENIFLWETQNWKDFRRTFHPELKQEASLRLFMSYLSSYNFFKSDSYLC